MSRTALAFIVALSLYYLYRAINYRFIHPDRLGPDLFNKQIWYSGHLVFALPVLLGGPLQFISELRNRAPHVHRFIGKLYVIGASVAALTALYLGATIEYEGSRLPLVLLASLWLFFTLGAWRAAVHRQFAVHRAFMTRSYVLAMVLVWLRVMYDFQDTLFFYVQNEDLRDTTREWASWVVPLLVAELWLSWVPQLRSRGRA